MKFTLAILSMVSLTEAVPNLYEGRQFVTNMFNKLLSHETPEQIKGLEDCIIPTIDHSTCDRINNI